MGRKALSRVAAGRLPRASTSFLLYDQPQAYLQVCMYVCMYVHTYIHMYNTYVQITLYGLNLLDDVTAMCCTLICKRPLRLFLSDGQQELTRPRTLIKEPAGFQCFSMSSRTHMPNLPAVFYDVRNGPVCGLRLSPRLRVGWMVATICARRQTEEYCCGVSSEICAARWSPLQLQARSIHGANITTADRSFRRASLNASLNLIGTFS